MKVLIAEDEPVSRRLLEAFLRKLGYHVVIVRDGGEAWEVLQQPEAPNLVISDWMMPVMDGLELCGKVRKMKRSGYVYFIILTAKGKREDVVEGLNAGADDYVVKPFDQEELKCRLKIGERIIELEQRILDLASIDSLTGVLNRRVFVGKMEAEIQRASRENTPVSLILADIDCFKRINDRYGHQVGDLALKHFSEQLSGSARSYDFVGRYGGEEFTVCLPHTHSHQSKSVAERMRKEVERMTIVLPDNKRPIKVTASFGVASLLAGLDENVDSIIKRADEALYKAKSGGRNRVCMWGEV